MKKNSSNSANVIGNSSLISSIKSFYIKNKNKLDNIFYILLCIQFIDTFWDTTSFPPSYVFLGDFYELFFAISTFLFTLSCVSSICFSLFFEKNIEKDQKVISVFLFVVAGIYSITCDDTASTEIFDFLLCISACIGKSSKKLIKILAITGSIIMLAAIISSQAGLINDYVYLPFRHSLGIIYCTDFGAHVLFLILAYCIYKEYKAHNNLIVILLSAFSLCHFVAMAKTASVCILITFTGLSIEAFWLNKFHRSFFKTFKKLMLIVFPLAYGAFCLLTCIYSLKPELFPSNTFTSRLYLTSSAFYLHGIKLFGRYISQSGNGGGKGSVKDPYKSATNISTFSDSGININLLYTLIIIFLLLTSLILLYYKKQIIGYITAIISMILMALPSFTIHLDSSTELNSSSSDYFWLDCSYIRIIICNGVLIFITIMILTTYIQYKAYTTGNYMFMFIMCIIALDCTIEHHLTDISYNFIFMIALTDYFSSNTNTLKSEEG